MEKQYSLAEVCEIVELDRRAGRLIRTIAENSPELYPGKKIVNEVLYKQFEAVLKDSEKFREMFFDFNESYVGRNLLSHRMAIIAMVYSGAKSMIKEGYKLNSAENNIPF